MSDILIGDLKSDDTQIDKNNESLEPDLSKTKEVKATKSPKMYFFHICFYIALVCVLVVLFFKIDWNGTYRLYSLVKIKKLFFLKKRELMDLRALYLISIAPFIGMIKWYFIKSMLYEIHVTKRFLTNTYGLIPRKTDSLELTSVRDVQFERTGFDLMFNLARIKIISTDATDPELILDGLNKKDGKRIFDFIQENTIRNMTEYMIKRDNSR